MSTVVSAKIPIELKKKADKYKIQVGKTLRKALEEKISTLEKIELSSKLDDISKTMGCKISKKDIIDTIRESRDKR